MSDVQGRGVHAPKEDVAGATNLSHITYQMLSFRKSTLLQNRRLIFDYHLSWRFCGGVDFLRVIDR